MILKIHLSKILLSTPTGWYKDEELVENDLEIDLVISLKIKKEVMDLNDTLDYTAVYNAMKNHSKKNYGLLEKLAIGIMDEIAGLDSRVKNINISVKKLHPPIPNFIGSVGIQRSKKY